MGNTYITDCCNKARAVERFGIMSDYKYQPQNFSAEEEKQQTSLLVLQAAQMNKNRNTSNTLLTNIKP